MFCVGTREKGLELIIDIAPDIPQRILTDPYRLRQVIINLMSNAVKFTDTGEICISIQKQSGSAEKAELLFCVKDSGIGIDPSTADRLFTAFAQADGSVTRKYGGTGLGLAICKNIVHMMDGNLWVESAPGSGSAFFFNGIFNLPAKQEEQLSPYLNKLKRINALIVDSNASSLQALKRMIRSFGIQTQIAPTAKAALSAYNKSKGSLKIDLLIIDSGLPDMDGIKLASAIKKSDKTDAPPVIVTSLSGLEQDMQRAEKAGAEKFLVKPIKQSTLFDAIMELLGYRLAAVPKAKTSHQTSTELSNVRVLLVEDNPVNQTVAKSLLTTCGIITEIAVNGREAVQMVAENQYDVVLMDIQMPEMDGIEATRQIRKKLHRADLPIIAMTAHAMQGDREKCIAAGMNDYVPKPIDREELFATLKRQMFDGDRQNETAENPQTMLQDECPRSLPGLSIDEGLKRLGVTWPVYREILEQYCNVYEHFPNEFREIVEQGDFENARLKAHSLKGAAGNISADALSAAASDLENACVQENQAQILKMLHQTETALSEVETALAVIKGNKTLESSEAPEKKACPAG